MVERVPLEEYQAEPSKKGEVLEHAVTSSTSAAIARSNGHSNSTGPPTNVNLGQPDLHKLGSSPLSAAVDLIKTLDTAFAKMNSYAVTAAFDAEEARRNARAASQVALRFQKEGFATTDQDPILKNLGISLPGHTTTDVTLASLAHSSTADSDFYRSDSPRKRKNISFPPTQTQFSNGTVNGNGQPAHTHDEDMGSLSLQLERSKQNLQCERRLHDETKSALTQAYFQNSKLQKQIECLLKDLESQRESSLHKTETLEEELERSHVRIQAAEEDAQLALDLAKSNSESREQLESWLQRALQEIEYLRETLTLPHDDRESPSPKHVRFANTPSIKLYSPSPDRPLATHHHDMVEKSARSVISAGRKVLRRSSLYQDTEDEIARKSMERRQQLRKKLLAPTSSDHTSKDAPPFSPPHSSTASTMAPVATTLANTTPFLVSAEDRLNEMARTATKIICSSGRRMSLNGRWWNTENKDSDLSSTVPDVPLDALTKHYCSAVEVRLTLLKLER
jgi:hypothetical protein